MISVCDEMAHTVMFISKTKLFQHSRAEQDITLLCSNELAFELASAGPDVILDLEGYHFVAPVGSSNELFLPQLCFLESLMLRNGSLTLQPYQGIVVSPSSKFRFSMLQIELRRPAPANKNKKPPKSMSHAVLSAVGPCAHVALYACRIEFAAHSTAAMRATKEASIKNMATAALSHDGAIFKLNDCDIICMDADGVFSRCCGACGGSISMDG